MGNNLLDISDFKGGLNTRDSKHRIGDNEAVVLLNLISIKGGGLEKRKGTSKYNSSVISSDKTVHSLYRFYKSAISYRKMLVVCDSTLYVGDDGAGTFASVGSLSVSDPCFFATWGDVCYMFNGTIKKQYDGTTLSDIGGSPPAGKYVVFRKDRLYVAGVSGAPNRLYFCETGDATTWNTGSNYIDVRSNDGDKITGILPIGDNLVVYKNNSIWLLTGTSASDFFLTEVVAGKGCMAPKSLVADKSIHYFLHRVGVYAFNGSEAVKISGKIDPEIDGIAPNYFENAAAIIYKERYWLSYTGTGQTENKKILIFDARAGFGGWTLFEGINARSFVLWVGADDEGELYYGDSGDGFVWKADVGADDGGSDIETQFTSKNFVFGNIVIFKEADYVHVSAENSTVILNVVLSGDHGVSVSLPLAFSLQGSGVFVWDVAIFDTSLFSTADVNTFQKPVNSVRGRGLSISFNEIGSVFYLLSGLGFEYKVNDMNDRVLS